MAYGIRRRVKANEKPTVREIRPLRWDAMDILSCTDMTEKNQQYAYFTVAGEFDPAYISQQIGITPSECWAKGDTNPRTQVERKASRWSLYSRLDRTSTLEAHVCDVLSQMTERKEQFIDVSSRLGGVVQLVGYFNSGYPGLHFDAATVRSLAEFAVHVDLDF